MKNSIDRIKEETIRLGAENYQLIAEVGSTIWRFAELGRNEYQSAHYLTKKFEELGFSVERGVGGYPTGFIASFNNGSGPVIAFLCEYDCLAGLSSTHPGNPGHGCGHNLYAAGAVGTAKLLKDIMEKESIPGTIKVFGTPAEENIGAKPYYVQQGLFNGVDAIFSLHPHHYNGVFFNAHNAMYGKYYRFYGKPAHAGSMPEKGRSALDALELMNIGVQFLREHVTSDVRIHYKITNSGEAANIVPAFAEAHYIIRAQQLDTLDDVVRRVDLIAEGAAIMTETKTDSEFIQRYANMLLNRSFCEVLEKNVQLVGPTILDETDQATAREMGFPNGIDTTIIPLPPQAGFHGGASDEGDVSWVVPIGRVCMRTNPAETPNHSVIREKQANTPAAFKAMTQTAKVAACASLDMLTDPKVLAAIKADHIKALRGREYPPYGPAFPVISTFPDAFGFSKVSADMLTVNLTETVLLKDFRDVTILVYNKDQLIGSVFAADPDTNYKIQLNPAPQKGDQLVLRYQLSGQTDQVLLGYMHKCFE